MKKIILYTTEHCPRCKVLGDLLNQKNIEYQKIIDTDLMISKGYMSAPILEIDGKSLNYTEAYNLILKEETNEV